MLLAIALRRSAVFVCQDTLLAGTCDIVLDSIARDVKNHRNRRTTRRLLINAARTDLPMPYQQPVLYYGTRLAVFLFPLKPVSAAVVRLPV